MVPTTTNGITGRVTAPPLNNDFDEVVRKLIRTTRTCRVSTIFTLWRQCVQDAEISAKLSRDQIDVVFGVILTTKLKALSRDILVKAKGGQHDILLPTVSGSYTHKMLEQDRSALVDALATIHVEQPEKAGSENDRRRPANPDGLFDRYFEIYLKEEIGGKIRLIAGNHTTQVFVLSPDFGDILWNTIVKGHVFKIRSASLRKTKLQFAEWCRNRTLPDIDDAAACLAALAGFNSEDACMDMFIETVGQAVGEFPEARKKAHALLAAEGAAEKKKGRIDRLLTKVQPKAKPTGAKRSGGHDAHAIARIDTLLSERTKQRAGGRKRQVPNRDFQILSKLISDVDHRKIERVYVEFEHIIRTDNGALEPGNDATDIFYALFRHADFTPFEAGIVFALAVYRMFPFNLDFLDCFFQNNMRFSMGKVMSAFPYLKNAIVWHLKCQADSLVSLAQANRSGEFDTQLAAFKASRRVLGLLDLKDAVYQISNGLYNSPPQFEDKHLQRQWENRFLEFKP